MPTRNQPVERAVRLSLALVVLLNAFIPMGVAAADPGRFSSAGGAAGVPQPRELPVIEPVLYDPPLVPQPQETGPQGDEVPSIVPEKADIEFYVTPASPSVGTDGLVTLLVTVRNNTDQPYTDLTFVDILETGLEYSPDASSPVSFDNQLDAISYLIESILPGEEIDFTYNIEITSNKRSTLVGSLWLHRASLLDGAAINLTTETTIAVEVAGVEAQSAVAALQTGEWNQLGRINVQVSEDTIGNDAFLVFTPIDEPVDGPPLQFSLELFETTTVSEDQQGNPTEQEIDVGQGIDEQFDVPAFLEIDLGEYVDLTQVPAGRQPFVATYDQENEIWIQVPILEKNFQTNTVVVQALHFSVWGAGLGSSMPQNGANVLLFDQPYTSLFTGSSRYSIPIWTPPGRAGMAPDLALSYSSGTLDGVLGDVQGSWVGTGWNMDGIELIRKITTNENGYGYVNDFALNLNGTLYELVQDTQHPSRYFTKTDAFLFIERHSYALGNVNPTNSSAVPPNKTGEWWEVISKDGTRYRLGWNVDSEQLALMYGYACTSGGINCTTPDGAYASLGYAGKAVDLVALRWRVDRVMDTHGNYMDYAYFESQPSATS